MVVTDCVVSGWSGDQVNDVVGRVMMVVGAEVTVPVIDGLEVEGLGERKVTLVITVGREVVGTMTGTLGVDAVLLTAVDDELGLPV